MLPEYMQNPVSDVHLPSGLANHQLVNDSCAAASRFASRITAYAHLNEPELQCGYIVQEAYESNSVINNIMVPTLTGYTIQL